MRVLGIDLSLTATGIAIVTADTSHPWEIRNRTPRIEVRTIASTGRSDATLHQRRARLQNIGDAVIAAAHGADIAVIESPSLGQARQGGQLDRHGLWWLVTDRLIGRGIPVATVTPAGRAKYATGKGNAGKTDVLLAVDRRYPAAEITDDNQADALVLAAMGCRHLGHPIDDMPKAHLSAMDAVVWP